ncbi:MAG: phospholipase D-like domain-containing protein [Actinomycetaceae bacterium]|nr:phospholipase D-like domain-containing protein [Actinomycetaceae bacterium]
MRALSRFLRNSERTLRVAKVVAKATVAAQFSTIVALVAIDEIRKRRAPGGGGFPALEPTHTQIAQNDLITYTEGESLYSDMLEAIESAQDYIFFETYIWKADRIGRRFKEALIRAAHRGVQVYCIYDGFGNLIVDPRFKIFPRHPNLNVIRVPEIRLGIFFLNLRHTGRDHRKILVVDGEVGFVGGYNIGDLYATEWRDTHVRLIGDAVWELENGFVDFWNYFKSRRQPALPDRGARRWEANISAALNSPAQMLFPVRGLYIDALERASSHAYITSAYFIPDREICNAITAAAHRGVDVKILVPKNSNHVVADWISSAFFEELLHAGVEIWLYKHAMIHAKTATVDGRWSTVGTANIDRLSMFGNYEINMQFHSTAFANQMEDIFNNDLTTSELLTEEEWRKRPIIQRGIERLLRPLAPLI